jgi:zinc-ribbon domain/Protein of unknown function (DUF2628)
MNTATVSEIAFCTSCGTGLLPGNRFCGKCGASVGGSLKPSVPSPTPVTISQPPTPVADYAGFSAYYRTEFAQIEASGERYQGKWNWAAFLFGPLWALTKGLWVPALIAFVGALFTGGIVGVIYWFIFGARGNYMYYRKVTRNANPAY